MIRGAVLQPRDQHAIGGVAAKLFARLLRVYGEILRPTLIRVFLTYMTLLHYVSILKEHKKLDFAFTSPPSHATVLCEQRDS